jgi:antitoxin HicB
MRNVKNYLRQPYARIVIPDESGGFHAEILEFPGCYSQGENLEEAYRNLETTAESWIEACLEQGQEIPEPSSSLGYSGRLALRLPKSVHRRAAKLAERDRTSLNTFVSCAVSEKVGAEDFYNLLAKRFESHLCNFVGAVLQWRQTATSGNTFDSKSAQIESTAGTDTGHILNAQGR